MIGQKDFTNNHMIMQLNKEKMQWTPFVTIVAKVATIFGKMNFQTTSIEKDVEIIQKTVTNLKDEPSLEEIVDEILKHKT